MNKEEAKKRIYQALEIKAREDSHIIGSPYVSWVETADKIDAIIDSLTIDHQTVKLPRKVGEAWIEYVDSRQTGRGIDKLDMALMFLVREECPNDNVQSWYTVTPGALAILADAYRYGWTAEKPKRYVLPMPGTEYHNIKMHGNAQYYAIKGTGNWRPDAIALGTDDAVKHGYTVAQSDIDAAPAWVKAITPVEVTDDEQ